MICQLLLYVFIGTPQERAQWKAQWHAFKERHIIADDPYDELSEKIKEEQEQRDKNRTEEE